MSGAREKLFEALNDALPDLSTNEMDYLIDCLSDYILEQIRIDAESDIDDEVDLDS